MEAVIVNLECITNMHAGNGDVNFNIIDNEVERDVVTGYPTINASGVKGALREYFIKKGVDKTSIDEIFGGEGAGKLKFLNADMLAVPARASAGTAAYYLVSTKEAVERYKELCQLFLNEEPALSETKVTEVRQAEGYHLTNYVMLLGKEVHIMEKGEFDKISLPVLARNKLNNGKSVNLWYEEVVPHKSLFTFAVLAENSDKELLELFTSHVKGQVVQFGGNASIGYGLCKVSVTAGR